MLDPRLGRPGLLLASLLLLVFLTNRSMESGREHSLWSTTFSLSTWLAGGDFGSIMAPRGHSVGHNRLASAKVALAPRTSSEVNAKPLPWLCYPPIRLYLPGVRFLPSLMQALLSTCPMTFAVMRLIPWVPTLAQ